MPLMTQPQVMSLVLRAPFGTRLPSRARLDQLALRASRASRVFRGQRVTLETLAQLEPQALLVLLELLAHREPQALLAQRALRGSLA